MAFTITSLWSYFSDEQKSVNRGENHYYSNHIESFVYSEGTIIGKVHASMKSNVYKVTVNTSGNEIISTDCECPRGVKCSHAAALIIHAIHNLSATDTECTWKKPKAPTETKSVEDMYPCSKQNYNPISRATTSEDKSYFLSRLKQYGQFTAMAWLLSPEPKVSKLPVDTVEDIILCQEFTKNDCKESYLLERLKLTDSQVKLICELTVGQRDNPHWHLIRKGRLTASNFGHVLLAKKVTPSLLKGVLGEYDLSGVQAISWGLNNESEAIKGFEKNTGKQVTATGLWLDRSGILGATPDGMVGENAIIEVKCPYSIRSQTVDSAIESKNGFYLVRDDCNEYCLKTNHHYWHQVQGQLYITNRNLCYFTVWTPVQQITIQIQNDAEWGINIERLQAFYRKHMIPRIIGGY